MVETKKEFAVFAHNVIWLRNQNKLSKIKMASIMGVCVESLNKIEKGILPPRMSVEVVFRISKAFGIYPHELFREKI